MPGTVKVTLSLLIVPTSLRGRDNPNDHFADEETETQKA